jgi:alanine racemase
MARKCNAIINLSAIKKNYLYAKSLSPNAKAIAIIKANAYGHGAIEVANQLQDCADFFGVACIEEAIELRNSGIDQTPILLMEGVFELSEISLIEKYNLIVTVCNSQQLQWLLNNKFISPVDVFVKYDSGMGRLGFQGKEFTNAINLLEETTNINNITLMTHFSSADNLEDATTNTQINDFNNALPSKNYPASLANSAGIMGWSESHNDFIRPGIMLYGSSPFPDKSYLDKLTPTMSLSSALISIKNFKAGQSIGYGNRYICKQKMTIGVVAIGYADGYPRGAKDGTPVFINGIKTKIAGKVSMDMITIDLSNVPSPKIGDRVELFGENIAVDDVAESCNTISYEIFTKITSRVYKTYVQ